MAEYYPLLAKAVAGLPNATPEARQAIYERARNALLGQLRGLDPPVPVADIERETRALDDAAARLEQELGAPPAPSLRIKPFVPSSRPFGTTVRPDIAERPAPAVRPWVSPAARPAVTDAEAEAGEVPASPAVTEAAESAPEAAEPVGADMLQRVKPAAQRPFAPQPASTHGQRPLWIVAAVVGLVVVGVAIAAWKLRDRPEDMAQVKPSAPQADTAGGKIVDRIGGAPAAKSAGAAASASSPAQTPASAADATAPAADAANPPVPVAYRAALLVEAPNEPNKVKTYVGTVVWHLDTVSGANQPVSTAVRADIDVPEAKLQARMVMQKNFDATLPASHTMKITFTVDPAGPFTNAKQISVPQMRKEDSPTGEALSGVPVPIMENVFLVGLSPGSYEAQNLNSIKNNQWIDVPMLLTNGHIAKLTFEKGTAGQRALDDAVASWQTQQ